MTKPFNEEENERTIRRYADAHRISSRSGMNFSPCHRDAREIVTTDLL
jgi:hypothetical protein